MYDPKFEKGVRQKMEGLEFTPSESVWANIQKAVADRRRRRGGFYFWRFALPAALLASLGTVAYFAAPSGGTSPVTQPATAQASAIQPSSSAPSVPATQPNPPAPSVPATQPNTSTQSATFDHETFQDRAVANHRTYNSTSNTTKNSTSNSSTRRNANGKPNASYDPSANAGESMSISESMSTSESLKSGKSIAPYLYRPALAAQGNATAIKAAAPTTKKGIISLGQLQKEKSPWEAGFTAGAGISRLNRLKLSSTAQDQALSANLYNIARSTAAPSKSYVSDIKPDVSFTAGIYLQKPLSRRWSVNIGMNLHYYSTRITIGQQVNTYVPAAASLITPTVSQAAQSSTAFIAGDRQVFTNHYYFLELPVNVQYQLNKSHLLPLFLEGGASLSRLMGSDALFYNAHSGVYYKDPGVLEKTQFNVASALMVGLPFRGIRIMAGPQVQYGVTPLVNNNNQGDQHFLYGGLRIVVIPGRK